MTQGETLYLLLVVAGFVVFAAALAYQGWQHALAGGDHVRAAAPDRAPAAAAHNH